MRFSRLTPEEMDKITDEYTTKQISEMYFCGESTVSHYLRKNKVKSKLQKANKRDLDVVNSIPDQEILGSLKQLQAKYGISLHHFRKRREEVKSHYGLGPSNRSLIYVQSIEFFDTCTDEELYNYTQKRCKIENKSVLALNEIRKERGIVKPCSEKRR